jgi:hypothetical protein
MQVGKAGHDGAAVPATADHQDANGSLQQLRIGTVCRHRRASSFLRYSSNAPFRSALIAERSSCQQDSSREPPFRLCASSAGPHLPDG